MIFIWDNDEGYSAHTISFIEAPDDWGPDEAEVVRKLLDPPLEDDDCAEPEDEYGRAHLLGVVRKLDWWYGELVPLAAHLYYEDILASRWKRYQFDESERWPRIPLREDALFIEPWLHKDGSTNPNHDTFWYLRAEQIAILTPSMAQRIAAEWRKEGYVPDPVIKAMLEVMR